MNRPAQLENIAPSASPEEAAAVVAALEQFLRNHAAAVIEDSVPVSEWKVAALHEGVNRAPDRQPFWA